jgi:hypothetical protein
LEVRKSLTLVEYVLLVPDSIVLQPGRPAGLLASNTELFREFQAPDHALNQTTLALKHWQVYSLAAPSQVPGRLAWARELVAYWGIQLLLVSFTDSLPL